MKVEIILFDNVRWRVEKLQGKGGRPVQIFGGWGEPGSITLEWDLKNTADPPGKKSSFPPGEKSSFPPQSVTRIELTREEALALLVELNKELEEL